MRIGSDTPAIVAGGASGLGEATVKALIAKGATVSIFDINRQAGERVASEAGASFHFVDVTEPRSVIAGLDAAAKIHGPARVVVCCAGICPALRTVSRDRQSGAPVAHDISTFGRVVSVNLVGTFNLAAHAAAEMVRLPELEPDKERGVIILTSSIAAEEGQIGQVAYAASKAGVKGIVLPMARDLARDGIRVMSIMPGLFSTPMVDGLSQETRDTLSKEVTFPMRMGRVEEFADLVVCIVGNTMLNGGSIRLDGAFRMPHGKR